MPICGQSGNTTTRCSLQVTLLNQKRFNDVFNRVTLFANAGSDVVKPHWPAVTTVNHAFKLFTVHHVKALGVDIKHRQRLVGDVQADVARPFDIGVVTHTAQQAVGDTRCAA